MKKVKCTFQTASKTNGCEKCPEKFKNLSGEMCQGKREFLWKGFKISSVCRQDIFDSNSDLTLEQILQITDEEMEYIAEKMGDGFTEYGGYWDALGDAVNTILDDKQEQKG